MLPSDRIVVAVSGGVDSVVLLHVLWSLAEAPAQRLHLAHLDHRLRETSGRDADFVRRLADRLGLPVSVESVDVAQSARDHGESLERAGRRCRRDHWQRIRAEYDCQWTALGHHAQDQAETVLLRLMRGAGLTGLGAMRPLAHESVVRPLLEISRADIEAYASANDLAYVHDTTNDERTFVRNRVRHDLLPQMETFNPRIVAGLARTAGLLQDEDDFLQKAAESAFHQICTRPPTGGLILDVERLHGYHIAVQRRVLRQCIQELAADDAEGAAVVERLLRQVQAGPGSMVSLTGTVRAQNTGSSLVLRSGFPSSIQADVRLPGSTDVPGCHSVLQVRYEDPDAESLPTGNWRAVFDANVADGGRLCLRSPRSGDRLQPFGMDGRHKKLSDCFIDAKWPRILRPDALLLTRVAADSEQILWVAGLARSDAYPVTSKTERILCLEIVDAPVPPQPQGT